MEQEKLEIILTETNINRLKSLQQQIQALNGQVNEVVSIILEAKEIEYKDKKITLSNDFKTITIE
jgi:TolA-binding protein